jgi:UDPglucose 6-dehydrogenase
VTKHSQYFKLDLDKIKKVMRTPTIVDGRNVFDTQSVIAKGFEYRAIGKRGIQHLASQD